MTANQQPNSPGRTPLWIIAFSLLTIAICLVALVLRSFTGREPEAAATVESPARETPARDRIVRVVNPARAASAPAEASDSDPMVLVVEAATQTVVQTSQTIVITPRLEGLALGAKSNSAASSRSAELRNGIVMGRVTVASQPPPETPFDVTGFPECAHLAEHPPTTHDYVVGPDDGLAEVVVRLNAQSVANLPPVAVAARPRTFELVFTNCELRPHLVALSLNDTLEVRNDDAMQHVLQVDLGSGMQTLAVLEPGLKSNRLLLTEAKLFIPVQCGLHPWEQAHVSVMKDGLFAVTDLRGRYAISNVPPRSYQVEASHRATPDTNGLVKNVRVTSGSTNFALFRITPQR